MNTKNPAGVESFTTRIYVLALLLVAMLSLTAYLTLRKVISEHRSRGSVINVSGRQRMLSQRILAYVEAWNNSSAGERPAIRSQVETLLNTFEASHRDLSRGSEDLGHPTAEVSEVYFGAEHLDSDVSSFVANVRDLINGRGPQAELLESTREVARNQILQKLDHVVTLNQQESDGQVLHLHNIEIVVLVLTLALLVIEALFIFRPMTQRITQLLKVASDSWAAAVKATDAKSAFLATVTHEIRTPLTGVLGIIENMRAAPLPDHQQDQVQMLNRPDKIADHAGERHP